MEKENRNIAILENKARNLRLKLNLTQKEFGEVLGISKSYMSDIENGYSGLSIEHLNSICNYCDVSFDYMFDFSKDVNKNIAKVQKINLKILGNNLRAIRKSMNYTQDKLAKN